MTRFVATKSVTPVVTAAAYSAGDAVGGLMTFSNVGDRGFITEVQVIDQAAQSVAYELYLSTDSGFTATATDSAMSISDADILNTAIQPVQIANAHDYTVSAVIGSGDIKRRFRTTDGNLYGQLVTRGAPTFAAVDDIRVDVTFEHE